MSDTQTFSARARFVLQQGEKEASSIGHRYVEPEHLLLAVLLASGTPSAKVLAELSASHDTARQWVSTTRRLPPAVPGTEMRGVSQRTRLVLKYAASEARQLKADTITVEHLLLSIIRETAVSEGVLRELNLLPEDIRSGIYRELGVTPDNVVEPTFSSGLPRTTPEIARRRAAGNPDYRRDGRASARSPVEAARRWLENPDVRPVLLIAGALLAIALAFMLSRTLGTVLLIALPILGVGYLLYRFRVR